MDKNIVTACLSLSDCVFCKLRHKVPIKGQVDDRFDWKELARAVKEVVVQQGPVKDALLKDNSNAMCKV